MPVPYAEAMTDDLDVRVDGVHLRGSLYGEGEPLLLLHGGPGLSGTYLESLIPELGGFRVASYQQRGLAPSQTEGPFTVGDHVADARRVLDALGWDRVVVVGHSWGGHLALHVARTMPDRLRAVLAVDPLGAVGDGGEGAFGAELAARTPEADWQRAEELDERAMRGEATPAELRESMSLLWPAYFPSRQAAPPMPEMDLTVEGYAATLDSVRAELPRLEAGLPELRVPLALVAGELSPMPPSASTDTAARVPGAWAEVVPGAGHFVWLDRPGAVRAALDRLLDGA